MKKEETEMIIKRTQLEMVLLRLCKDPVSVVCIIVLIILIILAFLAPAISPYSYEEMNLADRFQTPGLAHLCGTDQMGRDILSRLLYGARNSLIIGFSATIIAYIAGIPIGLFAAYEGKNVDNVIMRILDIFQAIPVMLLAIAISASLGIGMKNCIIALAVGRISGIARMTRAASLNVVDMEYIQAAKAMNIKKSKILLKHVLPNAMAPLIVQGTMSVAGCVMASAGLSFIGLGVQAPEAEWGCMLADATKYIRNYPHIFFMPLLAIIILVLALNLLGDGLRDALDPKLKD